jgi:hypothetical protein
VLHSIRYRSRSLADEVRIQLLAVKNLSGDEIPSILVPLGNPGADTRANAPTSEPQTAANAEIEAGLQD